MRRLARPALAAILLPAGAAPAAAHGTLEGVASFYAGLLHPLLVAAHLLLLLGLGLLLARAGRTAAPSSLAAWLAGLLGGLGLVATGAGLAGSTLPPLALAAAQGLLLAAALTPPRGLLAALAAASGLALGLDSEPGPAAANERLLQLAGTGLGSSAFLVLVAGALVDRSGPGFRIGIRVAGSWIAAAALMVLALALRGGTGLSRW